MLNYIVHSLMLDYTKGVHLFMILKAKHILQTFFGYETFRAGQAETINNVFISKTL